MQGPCLRFGSRTVCLGVKMERRFLLLAMRLGDLASNVAEGSAISWLLPREMPAGAPSWPSTWSSRASYARRNGATSGDIFVAKVEKQHFNGAVFLCFRVCAPEWGGFPVRVCLLRLCESCLVRSGRSFFFLLSFFFSKEVCERSLSLVCSLACWLA